MTQSLITAEDVLAAHSRLASVLDATPMETLPGLSGLFLKAEQHQPTGSFKIRGAYNKLLTLSSGARAKGVIAASSGNHGAAIAYAASQLGISARIYVPHGASEVKIDKMRSAGAVVEVFGYDGLDTELEARAESERLGLTYVSPYNDRVVVEGQGTAAVEIARQLPSVSRMYVAVGGGGLIAGIAAYLAEAMPQVQIIGVLPEHSPVMAASVRAGRIVEMESQPTLSDATAGGIEPAAITFDLCRTLVHQWVTVSELEIADAMRYWAAHRSDRIEGAAGVALAAYMRDRGTTGHETSCVVVCGGNITESRWDEVQGKKS